MSSEMESEMLVLFGVGQAVDKWDGCDPVVAFAEKRAPHWTNS
jgi:hypothetical protein